MYNFSIWETTLRSFLEACKANEMKKLFQYIKFDLDKYFTAYEKIRVYLENKKNESAGKFLNQDHILTRFTRELEEEQSDCVRRLFPVVQQQGWCYSSRSSPKNCSISS